MITRRTLFRRTAQLGMAGLALGGYAVGAEPFRLTTVRRRPRPPGWPEGRRLTIAALADIHACLPWMGPERIGGIVEATNALNPDLIVLLGDYVTDHRFITEPVDTGDYAPVLGQLSAPLGVWAILGNHDWWDDDEAQARGSGPTRHHRALRDAGIRVMENDAVRLDAGTGPFWLAGLGDQLAFRPREGRGFRGVHDLEGTLARISDDAPAILLAHEPDIFPRIPARFALTLAGHTHGGQVRVAGYSPVVPSSYGNRFAYGHIRERDPAGEMRDMIVSGGLGCSIAPVRFGMPPEIVMVEL